MFVVYYCTEIYFPWLFHQAILHVHVHVRLFDMWSVSVTCIFTKQFALTYTLYIRTVFCSYVRSGVILLVAVVNQWISNFFLAPSVIDKNEHVASCLCWLTCTLILTQGFSNNIKTNQWLILQDCFWRGKSSQGHKQEHDVREYSTWVSWWTEGGGGGEMHV